MKKEKQDSLQNLVEIDQLTGVMRTYKFEKEVAKRLQNAKPDEYLLLSLDIDNFKYINEAYGRAMGDTLLQEFPKFLLQEYGESTLITRVKGDHFILFLKNTYNGVTCCGKETCDSCMVTALQSVLNEKHSISISQGIYIINNPHENVSFMMDAANIARLSGKEIFGMTTFQYTEEMAKKQLLKNYILSKMEFALENKEFKLVYQPKYCLNRGKLCGAEALVRWVRSAQETIYPNDFIPIFEMNRFIVKLDYYVFERICEYLKELPYKAPIISVNLSGITLLQSDLIAQYTSILKKHSIQAHQLEIEITESALIDNFDIVKLRIEELKNLGFQISMDDFGTGVSSLNRLKDINVHILKLDREFMNDTLSLDKGFSIIKNVIALAKDLSLKTVAEGVETEEQMRLLMSLGCEYGQGYFFGKPMEAEDFTELLRKQLEENKNILSRR